jgi:copper resistance protein C
VIHGTHLVLELRPQKPTLLGRSTGSLHLGSIYRLRAPSRPRQGIISSQLAIQKFARLLGLTSSRHKIVLESGKLQVQNRTIVAAALILVLVLTLKVRMAAGHAVLLETSPAANARVQGPDVAVRLRYNVRIEAARSRLSLLMPDNSVKSLAIAEQPSPDTLTAQATGLQPGEYRLRWQVLASDGHITRGEIPFTVAR